MPRIAPHLLALAVLPLVVPAELLAQRRPGVIEKSRSGKPNLQLPSGAERSGARSGPDAAQQQDPRRQKQIDARDEAFARAVGDLRRSLFLSPSKEEQLLYQLGARFDRPGERALALARHADTDVLYGCMKALELYGVPQQGDDIRFLLLTRPFRKATEVAVQTMVRLLEKGGDPRPALFELVRSDRAVVRVHAAEQLAPRLRADDAEELLLLAQQGSRDVSLQAVRLMGNVQDAPELGQFLVDTLSRAPNRAMAAVDALVTMGPGAATLLVPILEQPAADRGFAYAALALARIEEDAFEERGLREPLFTEAMVPHLREELTTPDPFAQSAAALGLAELAWRSDQTDGRAFGDLAIVGALVQVVAPTAFISHLSDLQDVARKRVARLAGKDYGLVSARWLAWYESVRDLDGWVGARADVQVAEADAPFVVVEIPIVAEGDGPSGITLPEDQEFGFDGPATPVWRFRGDRVDWLQERPEALDVVLDATRMSLLIQRIRQLGFPRAVPRAAQMPMEAPASVELDLRGARCTSPPDIAPDAMRRFALAAEDVGRENAWQLYRDREASPDLLAWWRAEMRWRAQHTDPVERTDRLVGQIVARTAELVGGEGPPLFLELAISHLASIEDIERYLDEERGLALVESLAGRKEWDDTADRIAALAIRAPSDAVWARLLSVAETRVAQSGDTGLPVRLFRLLGPRRLREAFDHPSRAIRILAMEEAADAGDVEAIPRMITMLEEVDVSLQRTAAECLGRLRATEAEDALVDLGTDPTRDAVARRAAWISLARIGAPSALPVLREAALSTDEADRRAVVDALGQMRRPDAVARLADIYSLRGEDEIGLAAKGYLRQAGDLLASPALRRLLKHPDETMRQNVALLLAEFQDPAALDQLIAMLSTSAAFKVVTLIPTITGVEIAQRNDRQRFMRQWVARYGRQSQAEWLISSLEAQGIETLLRPERMGPAAGPREIRELCRLMVDCEVPYLRCLAGRVLRHTTDQDFGTVSLVTDRDARRALADRYLVLLEDADTAARVPRRGR